MTNKNFTRSEVYLELAQAIHLCLEGLIEQGYIAHFRECEVIYEFTDVDARIECALQIKKLAENIGAQHGLSENAISFLTEHFQLKICSNNLTKCMLENLCFSPVGVIPTALNILIYSHIVHAYVDANVEDFNYADHFQSYMSAINEITDLQIPSEIQSSIYNRLIDNAGRFNQAMFAQVYNLHRNCHGSNEINHSFIWVKPERVITNPIEDESQLRQEFTKIYGELTAYILGKENFKSCTKDALQIFTNGDGSGSVHTVLGTFLQYPLFIFMSAQDNASMAQRLGEGFFALIFAVFAPSLTLEETPTSYKAHMVPVMSLSEVSKKVSLSYISGILDWNRSLCFGSKYFTRVLGLTCLEYHENFIKTVFPKGFKTVIDAKPVEIKGMVWGAYERGLDLADKRKKKKKRNAGNSDFKKYNEEPKPTLAS